MEQAKGEILELFEKIKKAYLSNRHSEVSRLAEMMDRQLEQNSLKGKIFTLSIVCPAGGGSVCSCKQKMKVIGFGRGEKGDIGFFIDDGFRPLKGVSKIEI